MPDEQQSTSRFTLLWLKAQPVVTGYIASLVHDRAEADDLVQSVALTAVEKIGEFDNARSFDAWVLGIARLKILRHYRTVARDQQRLVFNEAIVNQLSDEYLGLSEQHDLRVKALRICMEKLPDDSRELLTRRYFHAQQVKAIAEQLGLTPRQISKRLFTIRRGLERCISLKLHGKDGAA